MCINIPFIAILTNWQALLCRTGGTRDVPIWPVDLPGVGVTKPISLVPLFSAFFFQNYQNDNHGSNITFITDRCCRSSAAATPVKYERDLKCTTGTFAQPKKFLTEKLVNSISHPHGWMRPWKVVHPLRAVCYHKESIILGQSNISLSWHDIHECLISNFIISYSVIFQKQW